MDRIDYARVVASLALGKRLPDGVYVHVSALREAPPLLRQAVEQAQALGRRADGSFDVVRFATTGVRLSLLSYPGFFDEPFPTLASSCSVDLVARKAAFRSYDPDANPPVLHRKELLLPKDDPRISAFTALTDAAARFGLLTDAKSIGTKRAWEARLKRLRLRLDGHSLAEEPPVQERVVLETAEVHRHRTALHRYALSGPMQALWRHGLLQGHTVFDYGCGRGDDLRILRALGIDAAGWDPHFANAETKRKADVVNLGYVINVIEDTRERRDALIGAYQLAHKMLAVGALIGGRTAYEQHRLFRDGVLTSRGTFHKYFTQQELREYLEGTLGREPIAIAPGLFFIFCTDDEEQRFLAARQTLARCSAALPHEGRARPVRLGRWEQHRDLLDDFWQRCLELGRVARDGEYERLAELRGALGTPPTVLRKLCAERGEGSLDSARTARMHDLLVYLALNVFERRRSFGHLPDLLRRDVSCFWGTYSAAQQEATQLLFSIAKAPAVLDACKAANHAGLGHLDGDHSLYAHSSQVPRLPALLRVYVGCAARLYGEVESADLVKIHAHSGKLTLLTYDDFAGKPLPQLLERVKVNMRAQQVQFFDYGADSPQQLLYKKSQYIPPDFPHYAQQVEFDRQLAALGLDLSGYGPDAATLDATLARSHGGLRVAGFSLRRAAHKLPTT